MSASVPADRRGQVQVLLGVVRLLLARQRGNLQAVADEAQRLQVAAEAPEAAQLGQGEELRGLALISLGVTEFWTAQCEEAERHLEQGVALARRIGRPFLEFSGLAYLAAVAVVRSPYALVAERGMQAVELARQHGWTDEPTAGVAYVALADERVLQRRLEEAEIWVRRAERTVRAEAEPAVALGIHYIRGVFELASGHDQESLAAFGAAERLAGHLAAPHYLLTRTRVLRLHALVRLGETERAERALARLGEQDQERGETCVVVAALRLAQDDPHAATIALAPALDGSASVDSWTWLVHVFLLEAIARDALSDPGAAGRALERALDLAEPDGALSAFLIHPAPRLLQRHARDCARHAVLIAEILSRLPAGPPGGPRGAWGGRQPLQDRGGLGGSPPRLIEPLSQSEIRVLRYLPTNLSAREIARELSVSLNTVRTHSRHIFAKLGVHRRTEAVTRARALGLLAPAPALPEFPR
jgi:LuxR family transcriptional regulator, maltose regulon positive regulatory protein